jgi:hypothetical protein
MQDDVCDDARMTLGYMVYNGILVPNLVVGAVAKDEVVRNNCFSILIRRNSSWGPYYSF